MAQTQLTSMSSLMYLKVGIIQGNHLWYLILSQVLFNVTVEFKGDTKKSGIKELPFSLYVRQERREKIISGIFDKNEDGLKRMEVLLHIKIIGIYEIVRI